MFKVGAFHPPDAMFRTERAAHFLHQIMHSGLNLGFLMVVIGAGFSFKRENIVMQIAVPNMAETIDAELSDAGQNLTAFGDKVGDGTQRDGDIMT